MSTDVRRMGLLACTFLVLLRLSIGWHFLYEGLWKLNTLRTAQPWTAAGYLKNAQGPLRSYFRNLADDPYEFHKHDLAHMSAYWDQWTQLFRTHHRDLSESQTKALLAALQSVKKKLQEKLADPDWAGIVRQKYEGTVDHKTLGEIELYRRLVERYESRLPHVRQDFEREHLNKIWAELEEKRRMLSEPAHSLTAELKAAAAKLLTVDQLARGPSPDPPSKVKQVDQLTIWGLIGVGSLLLVGLFTRTAALGAVVLLTLFYLPVPPWPGVPDLAGPEHALIVNKNFVEAMACLVLAASPTGRWIGLDALVRRFLLRIKTD